MPESALYEPDYMYVLVQSGFELRQLLGLFFQSYCILGLGVRLLFKQGALIHLTALRQLLQCVLKLELRAVTVALSNVAACQMLGFDGAC